MAYEYSHPGAQDFFFESARDATLSDQTGKTLCTGGEVTAGGSTGNSWVAEVTFRRSCALPGTQYISVNDSTGYTNIFGQR